MGEFNPLMTQKRPFECDLDNTSIQPLAKIARKFFERASKVIISNEPLTDFTGKIIKINSKSKESERCPKLPEIIVKNATKNNAVDVAADIFKFNSLKRALELDVAEDGQCLEKKSKRCKIEKNKNGISVSKGIYSSENMNEIIKNPGLRHIAEDIFRCLDKKQDLLNCRLVNNSWKEIVDQPIFWLKKINEENLWNKTTNSFCHICGQWFFQNDFLNLAPHSGCYRHIIQNWKDLTAKIDHYILNENFTLILTKMYQSPNNHNIKWPLEIVYDLKNFRKFSSLRNFILEQECAKVKIDKNLLWDEENLLFYLAALNGLTRLVYKMEILSFTRAHNGQTPMHAAAQNGHLNTVKVLKARYYNPNCADNRGITPIYLAAQNGHENVIQFLAKFQRHCILYPAQDGRTPLHAAAENGHLNIVLTLLGATQGIINPNVPDKQGVTPIHLAAKNGFVNVIQILAPLTNNPLAKTKFGTSPIHYAAMHGQLDIVKFLVGFTSTPNTPDKLGERTPTDYARIHGHYEVVQFLEKFGPN